MKTAVDLWSNIIAKDLPSPHIPSLLDGNSMVIMLDHGSTALRRDFNSQVLKHRELWICTLIQHYYFSIDRHTKEEWRKMMRKMRIERRMNITRMKHMRRRVMMTMNVLLLMVSLDAFVLYTGSIFSTKTGWPETVYI